MIGLPSPNNCKEDIITIFNYLSEQLHIKKFIVHGESIGGMVACYLAKEKSNQIDLLICDRTFCSLDAVASRLIHNVFGYALKYIVLWFTNSVSDYYNVKCNKLILQVSFHLSLLI